MSLRHNVLVLFSLFFVLQTGCLEHHGRVFGGGRIKDGNYYVLEDSAWTLWWLTIIFPSVMTHMTTWHEIRVGDDNEERSLVDWMWWNGTTSPLGIPRDVEVYRWILDGELLNPNISLTQPNQRIRLLCNDLESYALLIQEERRLSAKYRHGPFALYERTGEFYTWIPPSVWNCSLWVIQPNGTRVGPYWIPYVTVMENDYIDGGLRSRYRTNALFCFESTTQKLYALYKEEDRYYFEYWKPNISVPVCKELTLPSEGEPFYCWVLEEAFGVASWNPQTQSALFTTFDRATLAPLSTTTAPHFPKPPSPERIPYVIRKCGDWIYVFDISMEYVLRFNLVTGGEERYCVKTK